MIDWSRAVVDAAHVRAQKGGPMTGPSPVDRGKPGSKLHVLSDATGLPMATGISAGNTADGDAMIPLVNAFPPVRSRRGPRRRKPAKLHGDKTYNSRERRRWLRDKGIRPRLARKDIESKQRLGRHRWVIERSMASFTGYRRLTLRYERRADTFKAFLALAAALVCFKRLQHAKRDTLLLSPVLAVRSGQALCCGRRGVQRKSMAAVASARVTWSVVLRNSRSNVLFATPTA